MTSPQLRHDLVISPFGASAADMVSAAQWAEAAGFDGVWTYDHITGSMLGTGHSRDCFTVLGAMAAATERVTLGPLVANMMNRHPAQLTVAMATLQSLSRGRAVLGIGAGAAPGSLFAGEHEALGMTLYPASQRARCLQEALGLMTELWANGGSVRHHGEFFTVDGLGDIVGNQNQPTTIIGTGSADLVRLAMAYADGVNLLPTSNQPDLLDIIANETGGNGGRVYNTTDGQFEVSVYDNLNPDHPHGGPLPTHPIVSRRTLAVKAPFNQAAIHRLSHTLGLTP